jgi:hypothetical protein
MARDGEVAQQEERQGATTIIGGGAAAQLIRGCIGRLLEASSPSRVGPT